jgi:hypothetical protein
MICRICGGPNPGLLPLCPACRRRVTPFKGDSDTYAGPMPKRKRAAKPQEVRDE